MLFRTMDGRRHSLPYSVRGCRAFRRICDALFCDAMSPEFKKANDLLLKIIKMNDRTDGMSYTKLAAIGKAFKENDASAAFNAYQRMGSIDGAVRDGAKNLEDGLREANGKLAEAQKNYNTAKSDFAKYRNNSVSFDRFLKAIEGLKAKPAGAAKLNVYADRFKEYGDFSKRIASIVAMNSKGNDAGKQIDMLKKSAEAAKAKFDKSRAKAEKDVKSLSDKVSVFKEMVKLRSKKVEEFRKQAGMWGDLYGEIKNLPKNATSANPKKVSSAQQSADWIKRANEELPKAKKLYEEIEKTKKEISDTFKAETKKYNKVMAEVKKEKDSAIRGSVSAHKSVLGYDEWTSSMSDAVDKFVTRIMQAKTEDDIERALEPIRDRSQDFAKIASTEIDRKKKKAFSEFSKAFAKMEQAAFPVLVSIRASRFPSEFAPWEDKEYRMRVYRGRINYQTAGAMDDLIEMLHKFGQPSVTKAPKDFETFKKYLLLGAERMNEGIV